MSYEIDKFSHPSLLLIRDKEQDRSQCCCCTDLYNNIDNKLLVGNKHEKQSVPHGVGRGFGSAAAALAVDSHRRRALYHVLSHNTGKETHKNYLAAGGIKICPLNKAKIC